uniref:Uncharacterized protein n=1 Tax=Romanomermis culicivorax TaxID=13658 RepID=A0A915HZU1_ROMCU
MAFSCQIQVPCVTFPNDPSRLSPVAGPQQSKPECSADAHQVANQAQILQHNKLVIVPTAGHAGSPQASSLATLVLYSLEKI